MWRQAATGFAKLREGRHEKCQAMIAKDRSSISSFKRVVLGLLDSQLPQQVIRLSRTAHRPGRVLRVATCILGLDRK